MRIRILISSIGVAAFRTAVSGSTDAGIVSRSSYLALEDSPTQPGFSRQAFIMAFHRGEWLRRK